MNPPAPLGTTLLPAATLVAAAFFLAGALSSASLPRPAPAHPALEVAPVEIEACERAGARSHVDCVSEAEGKALIRHAEWVAALEESTQDGAGDASGPPGPVVVVRAQRQVSQ
jgi:hypothetical protein